MSGGLPVQIYARSNGFLVLVYRDCRRNQSLFVSARLLLITHHTCAILSIQHTVFISTERTGAIGNRTLLDYGGSHTL